MPFHCTAHHAPSVTTAPGTSHLSVASGEASAATPRARARRSPAIRSVPSTSAPAPMIPTDSAGETKPVASAVSDSGTGGRWYRYQK